MKKIILLAVTTLIMMGCDTEPYYGTVYHGNKWDLYKVDDSTYIMFPKYERYYHPSITNIKKSKVTATSVQNIEKRK